jgi:hypothetical protein
MKTNPGRYPNVLGKSGKPIDSPSPFSEEGMVADGKAFASLMQHLKNTDRSHTVIMVQVENEPGAWDSVRDYSEGAATTTGKTWKEVFGERADEYFHAWFVARYIGRVAAAGKSAYQLPLYVNAALRDPLTDPPATQYESGGPTDNVIPIWKRLPRRSISSPRISTWRVTIAC